MDAIPVSRAKFFCSAPFIFCRFPDVPFHKSAHLLEELVIVSVRAVSKAAESCLQQLIDKSAMFRIFERVSLIRDAEFLFLKFQELS